MMMRIGLIKMPISSPKGAGLIGNRLLWSYKMITSSSRAAGSMTGGTGQIEVSEAAA
jgi:hypothetical protein